MRPALRLALVALGLAAATPRRYDRAMREFAPIFVVGITLLGAAGCSSRVIPRDQLPPEVAARQPEGIPYRVYEDGIDAWFRNSAPLTWAALKSVGETARANEAGAATGTPGR